MTLLLLCSALSLALLIDAIWKVKPGRRLGVYRDRTGDFRRLGGWL